MHNRGVSDTQFAESLLKQYRLAKSGETGKPAPVLPVEAPAREQQSVADNEPAALDQQAGVGRYVFEKQQGGGDSLPRLDQNQPPANETKPGTVEQVAARKRGNQDVFDITLNPSQQRSLETIRQEISTGQPGGRTAVEQDGQGSTLAWNGYGSTYPDYFQNKGYGKNDTLNIIDHVQNGRGVTASQRIVLEDLLQAKRHQETNMIRSERAKPSEVSAMDLSEGDTLKRNGEHFKVTDVSPDGVTLKDGVTMELNHEQAINYDRGTLKDESGNRKRKEPAGLGTEETNNASLLSDYASETAPRTESPEAANRYIFEPDPDETLTATGATPLDSQAHEAASSPYNTTPEPTPAQLEAGNFKKGHFRLHGLDISIENPAGSTRTGVDENGREWSTDLQHHYGYIKGTIGKDKDHVDVFVKPGVDQTTAGNKVFVVDQKNPGTNRFDEHKVLLGWNDPAEARAAYLANYDKSGPNRIKSITETTADDFKQWLAEEDTRKTFASAKHATEPPGVILDNLGLQQIFERVANAKQVKDVMTDIKALGRHVIAKGADTYPKWFQNMKQLLGSGFDKVRTVMNDVWQLIKNERGSVEMEAPRLRNAWDGILRAVNPMERGELAEKAGELLRERIGVREMNRKRFVGQLDDAVKQYEEKTGMVAKALDSIQNSGRTLADKVFSKMTEQHAYDFMQAMDSGDLEYFADKPALGDIASVIDSMFKAKVKEIQNLGTGAMESVRENYFPHIWEKETDPAQIAKLMGSKPLEGSKGFTKQRVFDDVRAGLEAGYKPVSQNPLDIVFLKMGEMDKYIAAHKGLQEMETMGLVRMMPAGEKAPEGFTDIAGRYGIVTKQAHQDITTGMPGELKSYRYVAVDEVAQVFNNYLSQTLYNNKYIGAPFTAYMGAANWLNQFQLGVGSLFHAGFTSGEAVISRNALGLRALSKGDFKGAAKYFSTAISAPVTNWQQGQKILDAMSSGSAPQSQMKEVMDWLQLAGARIGYDERFRTNQTQKTLEAWANDKPLQAVAGTPLALVEQSSRIILEHIVPQQKLGVFAELMHQWIKENPSATHAELRTAAQQKWSRTDARLGQVVYERYFIHNAVKNGIQALVRAPGWSGGTILEVGGGVTDALASIAKLAKGKGVELSDRTAYVLSLVTTTAIANGLATLFFTGEMPQDKDFLAFRTGNLDEHGKPERFVFPTYLKDIYSYSQAPGTTLMHKAHPMLGLAGELTSNKDYYGVEIRHPGDNPAKQVIDTVFHTATAYVPFWMRGVAKEQEREGSAMAQVAPFFGVMPAPADMNATAAEKKARELIVGHHPQGARTQDQADKAKLERKIETALRKHDPAAGMMIADARRDMIITPADEKHIRKGATTPPLVGMSRTLSFPEAMQVWEKADDNEKGMLQAPFIAKAERHMRSHPDQSKETAQTLRELRGSGMQRQR